jgi:hypothetical protein
MLDGAEWFVMMQSPSTCDSLKHYEFLRAWLI